MTATLIEHETIELPDLNDVPVCSVDDCDHEARWRMMLRCGCMFLKCDYHIEDWRRMLPEPAYYTCGDCGSTFGFGQLGDFLRIEPL
jgi:hypothetical protein